LSTLVTTSFGVSADDAPWGAIEVAGRAVKPGTSLKFPFNPDRGYRAWFLNTPVFVARGVSAGPALCLTAGIHGDELNGVEVARRTFAQTDAKQLSGTLIVLPAINAEGVRSGNRYLTDRRDLNRAFPGRESGSIASLIAHALTTQILTVCDYLVDLHTASDQRGNLPQIRADLGNEAVRELAMHFGKGLVIDGAGPDGSWRREAVKAGVPAIIYEAGEPLRFQEREIEDGMEGVFSVMAYLKMIDAPQQTVRPERVFIRSTWVRAATGQDGFFFPDVAMGDLVKTGDVLGRVVDPLTDQVHQIVASVAGEVIGMAVSRPVLSGYGLVHLASTR
jgi:predicted deacylase